MEMHTVEKDSNTPVQLCALVAGANIQTAMLYPNEYMNKQSFRAIIASPPWKMYVRNKWHIYRVMWLSVGCGQVYC